MTGTFARLSGIATLAADGSFDGWLEIPVDTLDTGLARRDRHLKSADFFDVPALSGDQVRSWRIRVHR